MKKEKEEIQEPTAPFWMTTYGDMVTLMLCFFILLISYSTMQIEKFQGALESFRGALGVLPGHESPQKREYINFDLKKTPQNVQMAEKVRELEEMLENKNLLDNVEIEMSDGSILVRLGDDVLFDLGKSIIKTKAKIVLNAIAKLLIKSNSEVYVEGHTDNIPINTAQYPSNWELSMARAFNVVKYFSTVAKIEEKNLAAVGHGEFRPLVPNTSEANRAKNRRVEIHIKWENKEL